MAYTNFGWQDAPEDWAIGDEIPDGFEGSELNAANLEAFGAHVVSQSTRGLTADTQQAYKTIALFDPTRRFVPVPVDAEAPGAPDGLARSIRLTSVRLSWDPVEGATAYRIYRDDALLATVTDGPGYRDAAIAVGETYEYTVRAVDQYGQWSAASSSVEAFIDPALNQTPTILVTQYGRIVRVVVRDLDIQPLDLDAAIDSGTLTPVTAGVWEVAT